MFGFFIITEEDLRIVEPLEDIETMEKKTVTFWCKVNRLNATLKWTKNGEEITFDRRILYKIDKFKHSLIIKDCGFIDEGEYTVTAGQDKSVAELLITEAPADFTEHLQDQTVTEFDDAVFTCQLSKEKVSVKWYRNGREIKEGKKYVHFIILLNVLNMLVLLFCFVWKLKYCLFFSPIKIPVWKRWKSAQINHKRLQTRWWVWIFLWSGWQEI